MKFHWFSAIVVLFCQLDSTWTLAAEQTRYITDVLYVPLRSGPSVEHKVQKNLRSGSAVQLVSGSNPQKGYVLVRTSENIEGWLPSRYLEDEPVAADLLANYKDKATKAEQKYEQLKAQENKLQSENRDLAKDLAEIKNQKAQIDKEYLELKNTSGSAVELARIKKNLTEQVELLSQENLKLRSENDRLGHDNQNEGIKLGIMAIVFGVFLGFVFPYLKPRSRRQSSLKLHR